jgi:hypothetical protein
MQGWVVLGAWIFAVLFAAVILGFASYELVWKSRRLHSDKAKLEQDVAGLTRLGEQLQSAAERAAALSGRHSR